LVQTFCTSSSSSRASISFISDAAGSPETGISVLALQMMPALVASPSVAESASATSLRVSKVV
jgi:hypothetical protein